MKDLTFKAKKITVLRGFGNNKFLVVQGDNFYIKGLTEKYKEFNHYIAALDYFTHIKE